MTSPSRWQTGEDLAPFPIPLTIEYGQAVVRMINAVIPSKLHATFENWILYSEDRVRRLRSGSEQEWVNLVLEFRDTYKHIW